MTKKSILMVMMGFALLGAPMNANAQAARVLTKGAQAISKAVSKGGGKAVTKAGATAGAAAAARDAKAASKTGKYASEAERTKTARPVTYDCSNCNGRGTVSTWNSYYGCYQNSTCSKCYGRGKITRVIRY